jgi:heat shock protein HtpX
MNLYTQKESNIRKTWLYLSLFFILIIGLGWLISYLTDSYFILVIAVIYSISASLIGYWKSDKVVLKMSHAEPVKKEDNPELYRLVENLCITAGLPLPKIYLIDSAQPNAFAAGRDPDHAVVAVTTGLLGKLERTELEGVIAHELSHIGNRDALLQTMVVVLVGVVVMMTDLFLRISFYSRGSNKEENKAQSFMLLIALALAVFAPVFASLIKLAISRKREYLADSTGALLTRYPEGLARALEKISADSHDLKTANNSIAHIYTASPIKGKRGKSFFSKIFSTHPPVEERIKRLRGMKT